MRILANDAPQTSVVHKNPRRPWIIRFGKKVRFAINRLAARSSKVPNHRVLSRDYFPWLDRIEAAAPSIRKEAQQLLNHLDAVPPMNQMSPDHQRIAGDGGWRSFFLLGYGYRIEGNCARCPMTADALAQVPGLVTALISVLEPGMHVGRHRGVSKGILIAHLGLKVPREQSQCRMDVDGETVMWEEGRTFVFDDTYPHEVWNDTNEHRVILLIQFRRPMGLFGRMIAGLFIWGVKLSPYIQDARRNVDYWEERMRKSEEKIAA